MPGDCFKRNRFLAGTTALTAAAIISFAGSSLAFEAEDRTILHQVPTNPFELDHVLDSYILTPTHHVQEATEISLLDPRLSMTLNGVALSDGTHEVSQGDALRLRVRIRDTGLHEVAGGSSTLLSYDVDGVEQAWTITRAGGEEGEETASLAPFPFAAQTTDSGSTVESSPVTITGLEAPSNAFMSVPTGAFASQTEFILNGEPTGRRLVSVQDGDEIRIRSTLPFTRDNEPMVRNFDVTIDGVSETWQVTVEPMGPRSDAFKTYASRMPTHLEDRLTGMEISVRDSLIYTVPAARLARFMEDNPELDAIPARVARVLSDTTPDSTRPYVSGMNTPSPTMDGYIFSPLYNQPLQEYVLSNTQQVTPERSDVSTGQEATLSVTSAAGNPEFQTSSDGDTWSDWEPLQPGASVTSGDEIRLRIETPDSHSSLHFVDFDIGTGNAFWQVTTGVMSPSIADFEPIEDAAPDTRVESVDFYPVVEDAPAPVLATVTGEGDPEFRVSNDDGNTWTAWTTTSQPVTTGDMFQISAVSHDEAEESVNARIALEDPAGGPPVHANFDVTSADAARECLPWISLLDYQPSATQINPHLEIHPDAKIVRWNRRPPGGLSLDLIISASRFGWWMDGVHSDWRAINSNSGTYTSNVIPLGPRNDGSFTNNNLMTEVDSNITRISTNSYLEMGLSVRPERDTTSFNATLQYDGMPVVQWSYDTDANDLDVWVHENAGENPAGRLAGECIDGVFISENPEPLYMWNHTDEDIEILTQFESGSGVAIKGLADGIVVSRTGGLECEGMNCSGNVVSATAIGSGPPQFSGYNLANFGEIMVPLPAEQWEGVNFFTHHSQQNALPDTVNLNLQNHSIGEVAFDLPRHGGEPFRDLSGDDDLDRRGDRYDSRDTISLTIPGSVYGDIVTGSIRMFRDEFRPDRTNNFSGDVWEQGDTLFIEIERSMPDSTFAVDVMSEPQYIQGIATPDDLVNRMVIIGSGPSDHRSFGGGGCTWIC